MKLSKVDSYSHTCTHAYTNTHALIHKLHGFHLKRIREFILKPF